jgi:uncharacterized protein (DUF1684 family)
MTFDEEQARHRAARERRLRAEDGWLSLVGRWVLSPGENAIDVGTAVVEDGAVTLKLADGRAHHWAKDAPGPGPFVYVGKVRYELLRQGDRVAIRARDPDSPARTAFSGLTFFPANEKYRVVARLERADPPRSITLETGLGALVENLCPGTLVFEIDGQQLRLDPVIEDDAPDKLFVMFKDLTNNDDTYGAGRFIYLSLPDENGDVVLDFNKAFNPPCALTEFASCPVVPPQNRLSIRIEAGEKRVH